MSSEAEAEAEAEYFCKDFDWEELRSEVEGNPCFAHHYLSAPSSSPPSPQSDVQAWKHFHLRHSSGKFFKERRYLLKEFPELISCPPNSKLLEIGCGNGSTVLPILRANKDAIVYACDCSDETLERAKEIVSAATTGAPVQRRFRTFCCDVATDGIPNWLACNPCRDKFLQNQSHCLLGVRKDDGLHYTNLNPSEEFGCCVGGVDFVTLIFTLSAVPLERMPKSIKECFIVLKPGGMVFFRDYGLYDMTMLRFEPNKRVGFREYMRSDGTRSYFFCLDTVRNLFLGAGFTELELDYCCVKSVNRQKGKCMQRVWVHGKFQKPAENDLNDLLVRKVKRKSISAGELALSKTPRLKGSNITSYKESFLSLEFFDSAFQRNEGLEEDDEDFPEIQRSACIVSLAPAQLWI